MGGRREGKFRGIVRAAEAGVTFERRLLRVVLGCLAELGLRVRVNEGGDGVRVRLVEASVELVLLPWRHRVPAVELHRRRRAAVASAEGRLGKPALRGRDDLTRLERRHHLLVVVVVHERRRGARTGAVPRETGEGRVGSSESAVVVLAHLGRSTSAIVVVSVVEEDRLATEIVAVKGRLLGFVATSPLLAVQVADDRGEDDDSDERACDDSDDGACGRTRGGVARLG